MTYYDAIEFLATGNIYKAIRDLSAIAEERQSKTAKKMAELLAEKRCVRNFVESKELTTEMKIDAIDKVTGEK